MDYLDKLEKKAFETMELTFENCFSCNRTWSAWSYDTMSVDDFIPFDRGDESFIECFNSIKEFSKNNTLKNEDEFYDKVVNIISDNTLYFNDNIDNDFSSNSFNDDIFGIVDLKDMYIQFKSYKEALKIDNELIEFIKHFKIEDIVEKEKTKKNKHNI